MSAGAYASLPSPSRMRRKPKPAVEEVTQTRVSVRSVVTGSDVLSGLAYNVVPRSAVQQASDDLPRGERIG